MSLAWAAVTDRLAALGLSEHDALVAGSAPMLAHGLVDSIGDLDLVVPRATWARLAAGHPWRAGTLGDRVATLPGEVEVFDGWFGEPFDAVWARGVTVHGVRCMSLADVLAFKLRLGRDKDAEHMRLLRAHLGR